jgi:hypothetical protein
MVEGGRLEPAKSSRRHPRLMPVIRTRRGPHRRLSPERFNFARDSPGGNERRRARVRDGELAGACIYVVMTGDAARVGKAARFQLRLKLIC